MKFRMNGARIVLGAMLTVILACSSVEKIIPPAPTESPAPQETDVPQATATEYPTDRPTARPFPTATPTPPCVPAIGSDAMRTVQKEVDALLPGATVVWYDDFLCSDWNYGWGVGYQNPNTSVSISDGVLTFRTKAVKDVWDGIGRTEWNIQDRTGILVLFRSEEKTSANLFIHTGTWQTSDFRRWGFEIRLAESRKAIWSGFEGTDWIDGGSPAAGVSPDIWYYLFIGLGDAGQVTMKVWEKDQPEKHSDFYRVMGSSWTGRRWRSLFQVYDGAIQLDRYMEVAFVGGE
jgi:hypothetical protein